MNERFSTNTAKIRALKTSMLSLLESGREGDVPNERIREGANFLLEAYQHVLNEGSKQLVDGSPSGFAQAIQDIEVSFSHWGTVMTAFRKTLDMAYEGAIPKDHLLLDSVFTKLQTQVGEPLASLHSRLRAMWTEHLSNAPWDAYLGGDFQTEAEELNDSLRSLMHGDHLDVEDAIEGLTGPMRYTFANFLENREDAYDMIEESLWMRAEIVVMNDYWRMVSPVRLLDVIARKGRTECANSFAKVQNFFTTGNTNGTLAAAEGIVNDVKKIRHDMRDPYLRCLMLHPDHEVRRYATNNIDIEGFWKVVTPQVVPCATILSMLETVVGSRNYDENFQKVFFNSIYRRLFSLASRAEVLYARGIVRILMQLSFFMEDTYFEKLLRLVDYVSAKEKQFNVVDNMLDEYLAQLRTEKQAVGNIKSDAPNLANIPPVVLRKLARDGHYWYDLSMHPMFKIARETITHINTPARALRIANCHGANQDVLRAVGRNRAFFNTLPAKTALLTNPRTPPTVSLNYIVDFGRTEIERLLRKSTIHPELRMQLRSRLNR